MSRRIHSIVTGHGRSLGWNFIEAVGLWGAAPKDIDFFLFFGYNFEVLIVVITLIWQISQK